ncbi:unnamed protein product, partial [Choristocarpus tenellus]
MTDNDNSIVSGSTLDGRETCDTYPQQDYDRSNFHPTMTLSSPRRQHKSFMSMEDVDNGDMDESFDLVAHLSNVNDNSPSGFNACMPPPPAPSTLHLQTSNAKVETVPTMVSTFPALDLGARSSPVSTPKSQNVEGTFERVGDASFEDLNTSFRTAIMGGGSPNDFDLEEEDLDASAGALLRCLELGGDSPESAPSGSVLAGIPSPSPLPPPPPPIEIGLNHNLGASSSNEVVFFDRLVPADELYTFPVPEEESTSVDGVSALLESLGLNSDLEEEGGDGGESVEGTQASTSEVEAVALVAREMAEEDTELTEALLTQVGTVSDANSCAPGSALASPGAAVSTSLAVESPLATDPHSIENELALSVAREEAAAKIAEAAGKAEDLAREEAIAAADRVTAAAAIAQNVARADAEEAQAQANSAVVKLEEFFMRSQQTGQEGDSARGATAEGDRVGGGDERVVAQVHPEVSSTDATVACCSEEAAGAAGAAGVTSVRRVVDSDLGSGVLKERAGGMNFVNAKQPEEEVPVAGDDASPSTATMSSPDIVSKCSSGDRVGGSGRVERCAKGPKASTAAGISSSSSPPAARVSLRSSISGSGSGGKSAVGDATATASTRMRRRSFMSTTSKGSPSARTAASAGVGFGVGVGVGAGVGAGAGAGADASIEVMSPNVTTRKDGRKSGGAGLDMLAAAVAEAPRAPTPSRRSSGMFSRVHAGTSSVTVAGEGRSLPSPQRSRVSPSGARTSAGRGRAGA